MSQPAVLVLGDANVDMVIRLPAGEAATQQEPPQLYGGGSAANTAVALARLGLPVAFAGAVGEDGYGHWVRQDLQQEGIDTHLLRLAPQAFTLMAMAIIDARGERRLFIWPPTGAAHIFYRTTDLEPDRLSSAAWLHTSGICLRYPPLCDTILEAMRLARQAGVPISLDLNLRIETFGMSAADRERFWQAIRLADVVFGGAEEEIMPLTGTADPDQAARALSAHAGGNRTVVARLGSRGALAAANGAVCYAPAFPVQVVDTLGAGDAFDGGFIAARLAGCDLAGCLRRGNAVAAIKIGRPGARGLPNLEEVQQLEAQWTPSTQF